MKDKILLTEREQNIIRRMTDEEITPLNNLVLTIAYAIKYDNINNEEIYDIIEKFYKDQEYNIDGTYFEFMMESMKNDNIDYKKLLNDIYEYINKLDKI